MYFYELHEEDEELFSDALLGHEQEFDEEEFLELVLDARREVLERFEEDTLVEAIANELERRHGFLHIDDSRLRASVDVSAAEGETHVTPVEERTPTGEIVEDEHYRSLIVGADGEDDDDDEDRPSGPIH